MDDRWEEATEALCNSEFTEAVALWRGVLETSRVAVVRDGTAGVDERSPRAAVEAIRLSPVHVMSPNIGHSVDSFSAHNHFSIYNRAFDFRSGEPPATPATRSLVAMYNIALSLHLGAFADLGRSCNKLQRARRFYELCLQLVEEFQGDRRGPHSDLTLLYLACLNNRAHIEAHFFEHENVAFTVKLILQCLRGLLGREEETDPRSVIFEGVDRDESSFFLAFRILPVSMTTSMTNPSCAA